jgi:hypothetical protein
MLALAVTGLILILVSYVGASGTPHFSVQAEWLTLGIAGIVVTGVGIAMWLMTALRVVRIRQRLMIDTLLAMAGAMGRVPDDWDSRGSKATDVLVSGPAMTHFHRRGCQLVAGKAVESVGRVAHVRAGRTPCEMCRP